MRGMIAALACGALALAGCGASDEDKARETVEKFMLAVADSEGAEACELLTEKMQERFGGTGHACSATLRTADFDGDWDSAEVDRVTIRDEKATVGIADDSTTYTLRKVDGEWLIDDFD